MYKQRKILFSPPLEYQEDSSAIPEIPASKEDSQKTRSIGYFQLLTVMSLMTLLQNGCSFSNKRPSAFMQNAPQLIFASTEQETQFGARLVRRILRTVGLEERQMSNYLDLIAKGEPQLALLRRRISLFMRSGLNNAESRAQVIELTRQKNAVERELQSCIFNLLFDTNLHVPSEEIPEDFNPEILRELERSHAANPDQYSVELENLRMDQIKALRQLRILIYAYSINGSLSDTTRRERISEIHTSLQRRESILARIDRLQLEISTPQH